MTQGKTLDETIANLKEAVTLHLEGEDPTDFDLVPNPSLLVTLELEPVDRFLRELGVSNLEPSPKLSVTKSNLPEHLQVHLLSY